MTERKHYHRGIHRGGDAWSFSAPAARKISPWYAT
jgi:hypothetical protein